MREAELALRAGAGFDLVGVNGAIYAGNADMGADGVAAHSPALGPRRGLELWRHLHAQYKGVGPELIQRTVADLLTPTRAATMAKLQPALLRSKKGQQRGAVAAGHPVGETQRVCVFAGRIAPVPLGQVGRP